MIDEMGMGATNNETAMMSGPPNMALHDGLQSNATVVSEEQPEPLYLEVSYWGLAILFILLCCYLSRSSIPDPSHRHALIARQRRERRAQAKKDPEKRKRLINRSLLTKVRWSQSVVF